MIESVPPPEAHGGAPRIREIPLRLMVPNFVTVLALCAGMSGIRLAFEHRIEIAVVMVLAAAFLDAIDGRLARMLKATSKFGAQMDSLADIVNFGVAPALVLYAYVLDKAGAMGWIAALLFAIACGLRLARFNVMLVDESGPAWHGDYFVGVPAPAGAALLMLPIYLGFLGLEPDRLVAIGACLYTALVAFLMVSRLPVYSGKVSGNHIRREFVIPLMLALVFYVLLLASYTWFTMAASVFAYFVFLGFSARAYRRRVVREEAAAEHAGD